MSDPVNQPRQPLPCYCCKQPLTLVRRFDAARHVEVESWECTNDACITFRKQYPIPDPPKSK